MKKDIRVFIVDDDNMLIDGLMRLFQEVEGINYIGRANSPEEIIEKSRSKFFMQLMDIILMDVEFRNSSMDGIDAAIAIREKFPGVLPRIVFMTISNKAIADASRGFHGILPKNQGVQELVANLEAIHYNQAVFQLPT